MLKDHIEMAKILFLLVYIAHHGLCSELYRCPNDLPRNEYLKTFRDQCYLFVPYEKYWSSAKSYCHQRGQGHHVEIPDQETQNFVMQSLRELNWRRNGLWIGAYEYRFGTWKWVTGQRVTWDNWHNFEPSGLLSCSYRANLRLSNGRWKSYCDNWTTYTFICQYPMNEPVITSTVTTKIVSTTMKMPTKRVTTTPTKSFTTPVIKTTLPTTCLTTTSTTETPTSTSTKAPLISKLTREITLQISTRMSSRWREMTTRIRTMSRDQSVGQDMYVNPVGSNRFKTAQGQKESGLFIEDIKTGVIIGMVGCLIVGIVIIVVIIVARKRSKEQTAKADRAAVAYSKSKAKLKDGSEEPSMNSNIYIEYGQCHHENKANETSELQTGSPLKTEDLYIEMYTESDIYHDIDGIEYPYYEGVPRLEGDDA